MVISATDSAKNKKVAIKRIRPYAGDEWEARHTLREVHTPPIFAIHYSEVPFNVLLGHSNTSILCVLLSDPSDAATE